MAEAHFPRGGKRYSLGLFSTRLRMRSGQSRRDAFAEGLLPVYQECLVLGSRQRVVRAFAVS